MTFSILRAFALLACSLGVAAQEAPAQRPNLDCSAGPLRKTFGATPWLVYACSDGKSVVAVTASGSPAAPFYFMLYQKDGKYVVVGEGTGPKAYTDSAYAELTRLADKDISALIDAAKKKDTSGIKQ